MPENMHRWTNPIPHVQRCSGVCMSGDSWPQKAICETVPRYSEFCNPWISSMWWKDNGCYDHKIKPLWWEVWEWPLIPPSFKWRALNHFLHQFRQSEYNLSFWYFMGFRFLTLLMPRFLSCFRCLQVKIGTYWVFVKHVRRHDFSGKYMLH